MHVQEKRPSINDILTTPIVKARITKFLSATLQVCFYVCVCVCVLRVYL
jgi:hypothetical protein